MIVGVPVALPAFARRSTYVKVRDGAQYDFALASAAVALNLDGNTIVDSRVALGGVERALALARGRARAGERAGNEESFQRAAAAALRRARIRSALENLALAHGASDVSRIMDIVVVQDYARVDIQSKGRLTEYYVKDCGKWRFSGYTLPSDAPSAVTAQLSAYVTRDDGGTQCLNPTL